MTGGAVVATAAACSMFIAGCTVGPTYVAPLTDVPQAWGTQGEGGTVAQPIEMVTWWRLLNDPALDSLIERAAESNLDLRMAQLRVREARALRGVAAGGSWPQMDANASYQRSRRSENLSTVPGGGGVGGGAGFGAAGKDVDVYQAGFDASWELDFFGRIRRSVEAADAEIEAAQENRRDVLITVLAEVARQYVDVRGFQRRLAIAQGNIETQQQTLQITQARFQAGLVSELDVAQAGAQLATTQSLVPLLEASLKQAVHALGVLLGQEPNALLAELSSPGPIPDAPPTVPVGLPSDLLRRRPDIRAAERQLAAATARIGVATADLFPRFSLTGNLGVAASDAGKLFDGGSGTYGIGPSVSWPIFAGGSIRANIEVQNARQEQALTQYEQAVLVSLADVEDALVQFWKQQTRRQALVEAVAANRRAVELSTELYARGVGDFLRVLESQRSLFFSEDQLVQSDRDVTAGYIALYKALGGGWEAFEPGQAGQSTDVADGADENG